tara:strand:+ start:2493 stop:2906 length:414 start_codon:yes stop_codon:yes gene_type:complete
MKLSPEVIAQITEAVTAQVVETLSSQPAAKPAAKPKKPAKKPAAKKPAKNPVDQRAEWWKTDCKTTNAYRELKRADKELAKIVRVGCCHDVGLGKFASMSDVRFTCVNSPDLDFDEVVAANVEWASEGGDVNELDFA